MKLDNKMFATFVTAVSILSVMHGIQVVGVGEATGLNLTALLGFCIFNSFIMVLERWSFEVVGLYSGRKRYLLIRRVILYSLFGALAYKAINYRMYGGNIIVAGGVLNIATSYLLLNVFLFGKTSGKIFETKLL